MEIINSGDTKIKAATLNLSATDVVNIINKGTTKIEASKLNLAGYVTVSDLSGSGTTTSDGSNIKTGKISTDRLDVNDIFAKDVTATGTITGVTRDVPFRKALPVLRRRRQEWKRKEQRGEIFS